MRVIVSLLFFTLLLSWSSSALAHVTFSYEKANQSLSLAGSICKYGRASKNKLPSLALEQIQQQVLNQELDFIKQIKDLNSGMAGNRLETAKLAVFYQLSADALVMDYYFEGNQTCANYQANLLLNFEQNFEQFISLKAPAQYNFIAPVNNNKAILNKLQEVYPELDIEVIDAPEFELVEQIDQNFALYNLNYQGYLQTKLMSESTFYVVGNDLLSQTLSQYLTSYEFEAQTEADKAYWQLEMKPRSNGHFHVFYNHQGQEAKKVSSDNTMFSDITADSKEERINLILLQLELIELVEQLK